MIIDICKYQGHINWSKAVADCKAKNDELELVIHRVCGRDLVIDSEIEYNLMETIERGIPMHYYKFMYSRTAQEAYKEITTTLHNMEQIGAYCSHIIEYPTLWLDFEKWDNREYTKDEIANVYSGAVMAALDRGINEWYIGLYCNLNYIRNYVPNMLHGHKLWLAQYNKTLSNDAKLKNYDLQIWQYSSKGIIDGIPNVVDLNKKIKRG